MFDVKPHKVIIKGLHIIVDNFHSLINDGDNDIIYTGTNIYGNRILGSIVFEDDERNFLRYFHTIVTDKDYNLFFNRKISLRAILEASENFFIIDKDYNGNVIDYNLISFSDIPNDFLPLESSFCPSFLKEASLDYTFSLKGGLSDLHIAEPEVMSSVNSRFYSFLKASSRFVNQLNIKEHIYSQPAMAGSFELNFVVELKEEENLFTKPNNDIKAFLRQFYDYIFSVLPTEDNNALKSENIESLSFKAMEKSFAQIFQIRGFAMEEIAAEQKVIDLISYSIENLKEIEYTGFDRIELINKETNGDRLPVAIIDKDFYSSIENKIFKPESLVKEDVIEIDEFPTEYSIQVYQLNRESGKGAVYLSINNGIYKVLLHLRGRNNYDNTIFTKNMDEGNVIIKIKAIAKKVNGIVRIITYTFEN